MEKRPLLKLGIDSYGVSIPKTWLEQLNLIEGQELYLKNHNDFISIHTQNIQTEEKNAIISFDDISLKIFNKILISYYIRNYSTITIEGETIHERIDSIKAYISKLPSLEIIEIHPNQLVLNNSLSNHNDLNKLINLMKNSIFSMYELLISNNESHSINKNHTKITLLDSTLNQLYFSSIKLLHYKIEIEQDFTTLKHISYHTRIVSLLEKIGDIIKRISKYINKNNSLNENSILENQMSNNNSIQKELFEYLKEYHKSFDFFETNSFAKSTLNNLNTLQDKKNTILKMLEDYTYNPTQEASEYQIQLVVSQLIKDLLGTYDEILIITIDFVIE
ncbi:MAG: AbrB/MazE/SpoVT family DNA-binding domain-containing protein [Candidatus Woesearchaeota archaeon]